MKVSITTILGLIFSLAMLLTGILSVTGRLEFYELFPFLDNFRSFNLPSLLIVLGGVLNSMFIMYPGRYVGKAWVSLIHLVTQSKYGPSTLQGDIDQVIQWSERIQENKTRASSEIQDENEGEFAGYLFSLVNTKYSTENIRNLSENNIEETYTRKMVTVNVLSSMGNSSPAFGMFGTLFGLIVMLGQLDNPAEMGPGLAAALITTLYGISLAHLIFFPLSRKLKNLAQIERFRDYLIMEGVLLINDDQSSFFIEDKLNSFLHREMSSDDDSGTKKAA